MKKTKTRHRHVSCHVQHNIYSLLLNQMAHDHSTCQSSQLILLPQSLFECVLIKHGTMVVASRPMGKTFKINYPIIKELQIISQNTTKKILHDQSNVALFLNIGGVSS